MMFEKEYKIKVKIDPEKCNYDSEWAIEDFEMNEMMDFLRLVADDFQVWLNTQEVK